MFATRNGTVKKTELAAYNTPIKADGIIAINIRDDDELLAVRAVDPNDEIIMVSKAGLTVRFAESDARAMGRDTTGVRGMDVGKGGQVIAMDVARDDMDLLVVTENGYGKRTQIDQYRKTNRGAKGVKTIGLTEKKGGLAGALVVREHQELVFISVGGMVQRTGCRGHLPAGPLGDGRARDEPQGRGPRQRRRAGRRHRRRGRARRGRGGARRTSRRRIRRRRRAPELAPARERDAVPPRRPRLKASRFRPLEAQIAAKLRPTAGGCAIPPSCS